MVASLEWVFILLIIFQVKHFLGDFPLQHVYMLRKTRPDWSFAIPLALHCSVHGAMTLAILLALKPDLWWLALVDFVSHFIMDRLKSGPKYLGRFNDKDRSAYWNAFGIDQMTHHLTGFYIIWLIVCP